MGVGTLAEEYVPLYRAVDGLRGAGVRKLWLEYLEIEKIFNFLTVFIARYVVSNLKLRSTHRRYSPTSTVKLCAHGCF